MKSSIAAALIVMAGAARAAQDLPEVSDAAIAECQGNGASFVSVSACLPAAHVAIEMMQHIVTPESLGDAGAALIERCEGRNEGATAVWACTSDAMAEVDRLLAMVGDAERIKDPIFAEIARRPVLVNVAQMIEAELRAPFGGQVQGAAPFVPLD